MLIIKFIANNNQKNVTSNVYILRDAGGKSLNNLLLTSPVMRNHHLVGIVNQNLNGSNK